MIQATEISSQDSHPLVMYPKISEQPPYASCLPYHEQEEIQWSIADNLTLLKTLKSDKIGLCIGQKRVVDDQASPAKTCGTSDTIRK